MPEVTFPKRKIPCATLALNPNTDSFYVRPTDRNFLPRGESATYVVVSGNNTSRTTRYIAPHPDRGAAYQLFTDEKLTNLVSPVAAKFTLELDAGVVVNYPTRPMLTNPSMETNQTITNPHAVSAYSAGNPVYVGSVELNVMWQSNAGIVEAFIDQLHDPRNWFELPLPGSHLGTATVTAYDDGEITIGSDTEDNYDGWWVRVGRRTGRITSHSVDIGHSGGAFTYDHKIRITPSRLITGTTAENSDNNFAGNKTMRVRATNIAARGDSEFSGSWVIDFQETDGTT